jgi:AraC-like DNA-binding protein
MLAHDRFSAIIPDGVEGLLCGRFFGRGRELHITRVIDSHELIYVRGGRLGMFEGPRRITVSAGEVLLLEAGRRHGGTEVLPADLEFWWIHFRFRGRGPRAALPRQGRVRRPEVLEQLFLRYLDDQEAKALDPRTAGLLVALMLLEVGRAEAPTPALPGAAIAQAAYAWVVRNFHRPVGTAEAARALGLNVDYLGRVYRRVRGQTLTSELLRMRLQRARHLLLEPGRDVEEISHECGFHDGAHLRRFFRRQLGMSPREYRRAHLRLPANTF